MSELLKPRAEWQQPGRLALPVPALCQVAHTLCRAVIELVRRHGPAYLRLMRLAVAVPAGTPRQDLAIGRIQPLSEGRDAVLPVSGLTVAPAVVAVEMLRAEGVAVAVANVHTLKPFDTACVRDIAQTHKLIVTVENRSVIGGLRSAVAELMAEGGTSARLLRLGVQDCFAEGAVMAYLFEKHGLSATGIATTLRTALAGVGR